MSFGEKLKELAQRVPQFVDRLKTEEATKNALVMPFIQALGYDVFNPDEVEPELTADVGVKKGEKVDYAIKHNGEIIILIEAKTMDVNLGQVHTSQLYRYFSVTNARIAILTNGVEYRFFSDLDAPNKMDDKPFLTIDLQNLREDRVAQLKKLTKEGFDLDDILSVANDLKYMAEIRRIVDRQLVEPDEEFVRFFFTHAAPGRKFVQSARDQFTPLIKRVLDQVINDKVSERLRSALERTETSSDAPEPEGAGGEAEPQELAVEGHADDGIETTEEELLGYRIVKAIACSVLDASRITYRDTKSYFGVLCDDNNRKPICRLHLNRSNKHIGLLDEEKNESRHLLENGPESIYDFADQIREAATRYVEQS